MYIVKELHEAGRGVEYLSNEILYSPRTIEEDLKELRAGISILDQKVRIHEITRKRGIIEFSSTVHPLFLAPNLTQVVIMLRGLEQMALNDISSEYAKRMAVNIWSQLSGYGRRRIFEVTESLSLNKDWFEQLENSSSKDLFHSEKECSYDEGRGNVLNFLKNSKECTIESMDSLGKLQVLTKCKIITESASFR